LSALVILLLVARGEAGEPTTLGAVRATHELLGPDLRVEVREVDTSPPDERALELGKDLGAAAIIELSWESPEHRQARVHFHLEPHPGWNDRVIGFMAADDMVERGRTVGFAIASMLPASPHSAEPLRVWSAPPETSEREPQAPVTPRPARRWLGTVDALGSTALGIRGESPGWGGAASARWYFAPPFGVRLGVSARAGEIDPAQATTLHMHVAAGLGWVLVPATAERRWELGTRLDALAIRERLTHFDSDDTEPVDLARWLPGADAAIEGSWMFNSAAGLMASFATEVAFGKTDVTLHYARVATIPPLRLVFQAGVRASF
jgi:hypothetical protein